MPLYLINGKKYTIHQSRGHSSAEIMVNNTKVFVEILSQQRNERSRLTARIGSRIFHVETFDHKEDKLYVVINRRQYEIGLVREIYTEEEQGKPEDRTGPIEIVSPMSGRIVSMNKREGQSIEFNEPIMVLEAMKMENEVAASKSGVLKQIHVKQGDLVRTGDKLATIE